MTCYGGKHFQFVRVPPKEGIPCLVTSKDQAITHALQSTNGQKYLGMLEMLHQQVLSSDLAKLSDRH